MPLTMCTSCRISQVCTESEGEKDRRLKRACAQCLPRLREWAMRSDAAKKAVATKRRKYKTWPTRTRSHLT